MRADDEDVVAAAEVHRLEERVRELERMLGRKTMEVEILKRRERDQVRRQKAREALVKEVYEAALNRALGATGSEPSRGHRVKHTTQY